MLDDEVEVDVVEELDAMVDEIEVLE
jgi:hypothetical protein